MRQGWRRLSSAAGPSSSTAASATKLCCSGKCFKAHHIRVLRNVTRDESRRLVAELGACERGLAREDLISITRALADRGALKHAWDALNDMGRRGMRPSLVAHNSLLEAYARTQRWDLGMRCACGRRAASTLPLTRAALCYAGRCLAHGTRPPVRSLARARAACSCACSSTGCGPTSRASPR